MIKLYGTPKSRARRCMWLLEELDLRYELVHVAPRDEKARSDEYRALNPMSKVPTLVDDGLTLTESLAINLYLARRYGKEWWPASVEVEAQILQWTLFSATELDSLFFTVIFERMLKPESARLEAAASQAQEMLARPFAVLDRHLEKQAFLINEEFGLADLNVSSVCMMGRRVGFDYDAYPHAKAWTDRCWSRPACRKIDALT